MKQKNREYKTLLSVLANGSTEAAEKLLEKHSGEKAKDIDDLAEKLAKVYALSNSKLDLEREFAEIHPHKNFILKYTKPVEVIEKQPLQPVEEKKDDTIVKKEVVLHEGYCDAEGKAHAPCGDPNCPYCKRYFSSMDGNSGCPRRQSCPCKNQSSGFDGYNCSGAQSNADGGSESKMPQIAVQTLAIMGMVTVVALFGMVLYLKTKRTD